MKDDASELLKQTQAWAGRRVLVVGDLTLDEYVYGEPTSISREAPVVVLEFTRREFLPGGACSPACTIQLLGGEAHLLGVCGADGNAQSLRDCLQQYGVSDAWLVVDGNRPTPTKTRICALLRGSVISAQQIARLNVVDRSPLSPAVEEHILALLEEQIPQSDAALVSNYLLGMISQKVVDAVRWLGQRHGKLLTVDSQGDLSRFVGYDLIKCNQPDAEAALRRRLESEDDFRVAMHQLATELEAKAIMITRGAEGSSVFERTADGSAYHHFPVPVRSEIIDVTGAGDAVIAVLTLALSAGAELAVAAKIANVAAGIVVRRWGNVPVNINELTAALG
ncbi:MAG: hypothetical protein DLM69_10405 [Candidatus Chloroheliales bacterium]|nr:MAG: hypothetical protein DLM69_10405 [Chloroflexota bacterium]